MNRSRSDRFSSVRTWVAGAVVSGLALAAGPADARDLPSADHEAAVARMAAEPDTAEAVLRDGKTPTEELDYALFLYAFRAPTEANHARIATLLDDVRSAVLKLNLAKGIVGEVPPFDGSDTSLIELIRAASVSAVGQTESAFYAIPCGVLQRKPSLLDATVPMFGGNMDNYVPRSGCQWGRGTTAGFPEEPIQEYLALADRADGCIGCGGGSIRFFLGAQRNVQQERMRLNPRYFLDPENNFSDPKQAFPYQAWSYLSLSNRRIGAQIESHYNQARIALARYYRGMGLKPDEAMRAATRALFGAPFGAHCGEVAVTPSLRTLVMDGADIETIRAFIASGAWRMPSQQAISKCSAEAGIDPLAHVALRDPHILVLLSKLSAGLTAEERAKLDLEMDVNQPNAFGKTPLMTAAQFGLKDSAHWLIDHGAAVNAATAEDADLLGNRRTALHYAAASGSLPLIRLLMAHGASTDARDTVGMPSIYYGVKNTPGGQTPLDYLSGAGPVDAPKLSEDAKAEAVRLLTTKP